MAKGEIHGRVEDGGDKNNNNNNDDNDNDNDNDVNNDDNEVMSRYKDFPTNAVSMMASKGAEMAADQERRLADAADSRIHRRVHRVMGVPAAEVAVAWRDQRRLKCWIIGNRKKCLFPDYPLTTDAEEYFLMLVTCLMYTPT